MEVLENQPSIKKLQDDMRAFRLISWALPKEQRKQYKELKVQLEHLIQTMAKYTEYFSNLGWCAYDSLNVEVMENAVKTFEEKGIDDAEEVIINYYTKDVKNIIQWLRGKSKEFGLRYELILKAFDDHFTGRYYASIPLFLMIVDGAVRDFTSSKGFWADGTNIDVWDCLVGADDGLNKVKQILTKSRKKTNAEPIYIPYRHGILHGRDICYDNVKVSCKCVALMFAVSDWIQMKNSEDSRKEKYDKECNPPSITMSLKGMADNRKISEEIAGWKRRDVAIGNHVPKVGNVEEYNEYEYLKKLVELFQWWKAKNYGYLSKCFEAKFFWNEDARKQPAECKAMFSGYNLTSWEFVDVKEQGCGLTKVKVCVSYEFGGGSKTIAKDIILCYCHADDKKIALPWRNDGEWKVTSFPLL